MVDRRIDMDVQPEDWSRKFIALVETERGEDENESGWLTLDSVALSSFETFISYVNGQVEADNTADDLLLLRVRIAALPAQQRQVATAEGRWVILEVHNSTKNSTAAEVVLFGTAEGESEPPIVGLQIVGPAPAKYTDLLGKISRLYSCLLYTSPSPRDLSTSRMPSSA